jgi:hypothetical protein
MTQEVCDRLDFNAVEFTVKRILDPMTPERSRDTCLGMILDRVAPKVRNMEVTHSDGREYAGTVINVHGATDRNITVDQLVASVEFEPQGE